MEVEDTDWERAHLRVGVVWGWETLTERERTLEWKGTSGGGRCRLGESALDRVGMVWGRETPTGRGRT